MRGPHLKAHSVGQPRSKGQQLARHTMHCSCDNGPACTLQPQSMCKLQAGANRRREPGHAAGSEWCTHQSCTCFPSAASSGITLESCPLQWSRQAWAGLNSAAAARECARKRACHAVPARVRARLRCDHWLPPMQRIHLCIACTAPENRALHATGAGACLPSSSNTPYMKSSRVEVHLDGVALARALARRLHAGHHHLHEHAHAQAQHFLLFACR